MTCGALKGGVRWKKNHAALLATRRAGPPHQKTTHLGVDVVVGPEDGEAGAVLVAGHLWV
jgi:hypothetical protein